MCWFALRSLALRSGAVLILLGLFAPLGQAEQLPLKTYTSANGLARDVINRIVRDSRGFLWFATPEGLSQLDGYQFINCTPDQGLPQASVNDLLETKGGDYWIATGAGVVHFNPRGLPQPRVTMVQPTEALKSNRRNQNDLMFVVYPPASDRPSCFVNVLVEGRDGAIWCGTENGLYRLQVANGNVNFQVVDLGMPHQSGDDTLIEAMALDARDYLWIGAGNGLYRRSPNGEVKRYATADGLPDIRALRDGFRMLIDGTDGFHCTGSFRTMEEALDKIKFDLPQVVLADIGLPGMSGIEGVRLLKQRFPMLSILMLTVYDDDDRIFEALCAGACGYLLKKTPPARLLDSISEAANGGAPMTPEIARRGVRLFREIRPPEKADYHLTPHELRLLKLLVEGHNYKTAAAELHISFNTVCFPIKSIY